MKCKDCKQLSLDVMGLTEYSEKLEAENKRLREALEKIQITEPNSFESPRDIFEELHSIVNIAKQALEEK